MVDRDEEALKLENNLNVYILHFNNLSTINVIEFPGSRCVATLF